MVRKISLIMAGAAFALAAGLALAADATPNPGVGNWAMNVSKSKFSGTPAVKSYTITNTDAGDGKTHSLAQLVYADGTKDQVEYTAAADGKPAPVTGYPNADSVVVTKTGPRSMHISFRKGGKQVEWGKLTVSKDGKTMHGTEGGTDEQGAKYKWTEVFEKQ